MAVQFLAVRKPDMTYETLLSVKIRIDVERLHSQWCDGVRHGIDDVGVLESCEGLRESVCERHTDRGYINVVLPAVVLVIQR